MRPSLALPLAVLGCATTRGCGAQETSGGSLDGWSWQWGGAELVSQGVKPGQGLCLSSPPLSSAPCSTTFAPNGQCATAVRDVASDFVSVLLEQTGIQQQIGLHTAHKCSDRELWEFVFVCETNGQPYLPPHTYMIVKCNICVLH